MTSHNRMFQSDLDNKWYFWADAWGSIHGPFDEYTEAHMAYSQHLKDIRDGKKETPQDS